MNQSVAKVLVTGANGFLASYIIRNLQDTNLQVVGMLRKNANTKNLTGLKYLPFYGQITNPADVEMAVKGIDYVIHVAADTNPSHPSFKKYEAMNVKVPGFLLEACIRNNCKRVIFVSTANTMGYGNKTSPGTGSEIMSPEFQKSGYAYSKLQAEKIFLSESNKGRIEIVIVNPTFMIGYNPSGGSTMKLFDMYFNSRVLITTHGGKNFIYVDDAAKAIVNAIYKGQNGHRYLLANENLSYIEFYNKIDHNLGKKKHRIIVPDVILRLLGLGGSFLNFFGIPASLNIANAKILTIRNYYHSSKATKELNMPRTPIDDVISQIVPTYIKRGEVS